jgi:hypothetical protein
MGAAKVRKKNGTYPTKEQIAAMEDERRRWNTTVWHAKASDLALPYVPEHAREAVRSLLTPFVQKIPVKAGNCWWTAQTFAHLADTPRVRYVEGLWTRSPENELCSPNDDHTGALTRGIWWMVIWSVLPGSSISGVSLARTLTGSTNL